MSVFQLTDTIAFPDPNLAEEDGLLAVGGDLSTERILHAYAQGIFPWYSDGQPILWWSPDPRMVLIPSEFKCSKRLERERRNPAWTVTVDTHFEEVVDRCATMSRPDQDGTWITDEMCDAYGTLHRAGYAHSVEAWKEGALAGGLYGVSLGRCFFGESMFSLEPNASKIALAALVDHLLGHGFSLIDCQVHTPHLESLGARNIPRDTFLTLLEEANTGETRVGKWTFDKGPKGPEK